jgi:uncharacterized protein (DUF4415 family)/uncharacterized DUF497 family protein
MEFEWDEDKRAANIDRHGIDFFTASLIFDGRPVITRASPREGEDRRTSTGCIDQRYITVVWTWQQGGPDMAKKKRTVTYTDKQISEKRSRGEDRTDWQRVEAMTERDLESAITADPDEDLEGGSGPWSAGIPPLPPRKEYVHIGLDEDMLTWFRSLGRGYQTRINAVLRRYYQVHRETKNHDRGDDARH